MKKIIIVNNNMKVGGVQKSLYNLLWAMEKQYDITLYLYSPVGEYMDKLPPNVKVVHCGSLFRYLGISKEESKGKPGDFLVRSVLAAVCRLFGRPTVMKFLLASQPVLPETYDCAISFLHNGNVRSFYGGTPDFVLHRIKADKKVAFLHCDYRSCGANYEENNCVMAAFDQIAVCSDGCRRAFLEVLPELQGKCVTVKNCHRFQEIRTMVEEEPVCYSGDRINLISVGRLAHEKGVERAVKAAAVSIENGFPVTLHIVGGGGMEQKLRGYAQELGVAEHIRFHGEQSNPYRFMVNADLLLLTSYHEAAPMVIEEAQSLGLPVLTVETTSSEEMVIGQACGWVCENDQDSLNRKLLEVLADFDGLIQMKRRLGGQSMDNNTAKEQFTALIEG